MRSPMVEKAAFVQPEEKGRYSELMVLQSSAGFYIGTLYRHYDANGNPTWTEPGSRDSAYFGTEATARTALEQLQGLPELEPALLRQHP